MFDRIILHDKNKRIVSPLQYFFLMMNRYGGRNLWRLKATT